MEELLMPAPTRLASPFLAPRFATARFCRVSQSCHASWRKFWADEDGATLVEYVLLVALIAAVAVGTITVLGTNATAKLSTASDALK
jgi:pilus assembly protein Flp/PilA